MAGDARLSVGGAVLKPCPIGDRASRLPRDTTVPEAMRLYRENIALKAQLDALERH
jgi:hypothetical protein